MKLKALYSAIFRPASDAMRLWFECHACGYREVLRQPCSIDKCSKCEKRYYTAEMGTKPPASWGEQ